MRPPQTETEHLDAALRKIHDAEATLPALRSADLNISTSTREFARELANFGVLIDGAKQRLQEVPTFNSWWNESRPQSQRVILNAWDRRAVQLVIDACIEGGPHLQTTNVPGATYRHEFVTKAGPEPVYPACSRALGLMKEGHRVAAGLRES